MVSQIVIPVLVFTTIVLVLSALVLVARRGLAPTGVVAIKVNGQRTLHVNAGDQLLWSLAENGIYLPAACGGRGTCGQCKVVVSAGGGIPLPTEASHITPAEAARGLRLACMVKVRETISVSVPSAVLAVRRWECVVESNRNVSRYMKELVLRLPEDQLIEFTAGDYVLLDAPPHRIRFCDIDVGAAYHDEWRASGLLELESVTREHTIRAYSLANPPQQKDRVVLVVRIAIPPAAAPGVPPGRASSYIFGLAPGDAVAISGPFGEFHASAGAGETVFIAGGAGIAPIRSIILDQLARGTERRMSLWYGVRAYRDLCYEEEFLTLSRQHANFEYRVALSEPHDAAGWVGHTGFIHGVVREQYLKRHPAPQQVEYYLCGPPLMAAAVLQVLEEFGVDRHNVFFDDFGS